MLRMLGKGQGTKKDKQPGVQDLGITSLIAQGVTVHGGMQLQGGVKIHGRVLGDVIISESKGVVLLHTESEVRGSIVADRVFAAGKVTGDIRAREIHMYGTANITGEVRYASIVIHDGAILNGFVHHQNADRSLLVTGSSERGEIIEVSPTTVA